MQEVGTGQILGSFATGASLRGCSRERGVKGGSAGRLGGVEALVLRCIAGSNNRQEEPCLPQVSVFEASLGRRGILQRKLALR